MAFRLTGAFTVCTMSIMKSDKKIFTVDEIAAELRVSRYTVVRLIECGELPGKKIGRQWRVLREDLKTYLDGADR